MNHLDMPGYVSRFDHPGLSEYYEKSWILVNSSAREGFPYTFLEAAGFGVAILSCLNPESFASKYGYFVVDGDFESGLRYLLEDYRWRSAGEKAMKYVRSIWNEDTCINRHLRLYRRLVNEK